MHGFSMKMRYYDDYDFCDRGYYGGCHYPHPPCYRYHFPDYYWYPRYYEYSRYY